MHLRERIIIMPDCIIAMKTRTSAEKARRAAAVERIDSEIVSVDPSVTRHGCSFGLRLKCAELDNAIRLFDKKRIVYGDIVGRNPK